MTSPLGRSYALALALVVFFLAWATVAAHPWAATTPDPRLKALALREARLRQEGKAVKRIVAQRWAAYRRQLAARRAQIAATAGASSSAVSASPSVKVVNLPPLTITRTS